MQIGRLLVLKNNNWSTKVSWKLQLDIQILIHYNRTIKTMFADVNLMLANCFNKAKINEDCLTNRKDPTRKISSLN